MMQEESNHGSTILTFKIYDRDRVIPLFSEEQLAATLQGRNKITLQIHGNESSLIAISAATEYIKQRLPNSVDFEWFYQENETVRCDELISFSVGRGM